MVVYSDRKVEYFERLRNNLTNFSRLFIVQADNVGSLQMQQIRAALRGKAEVMMGKNTMMRRCIRDMENETFNQLLPLIIGNIGFVFTNEDLGDIRSIIMENKVPAPARAGAIAQCDVVVPAGNTGMEPTKTSFFQALGIATKITRGTVEIISDHHLITCGDKVDQSQAELLKVMNMRPFSYGLIVDKVFDNGQIYDASVLDITDEIMTGFFSSGITNIACVSLQTGYPTVASLPHSLLHGFKNLLAIAAATEVTFKEAEQVKAFLADPSAFVVAAAPAAGGAAAAAPAAEEEEEEEEEDDDMGFGLFD